ILWAYQGGRYALTGWLALRAEQRGWSFGLAFVAAYAATELLYPLLFPYYWAAAMHRAPVMTQIADLGGPVPLTGGGMPVKRRLRRARALAPRTTGRQARRPDRGRRPSLHVPIWPLSDVARRKENERVGGAPRRRRPGKPRPHAAAHAARRIEAPPFGSDAR